MEGDANRAKRSNAKSASNTNKLHVACTKHFIGSAIFGQSESVIMGILTDSD